MANVNTYAPGEFCWAELATTDDEAAQRFYSSLFGWTASEYPMGEGMGVYRMMKLGGRDVAAMFKLGPQMAGAPPHWTTFVSVKNVDETVQRAQAMGAKVVMPPMDAFEFGRCAFVADPTGAIFAVWQPNKHHGAGVRGGNATTCWNELLTTDAAAAKRFYVELFGWKLKESPEYNEITNGAAPAPQGGIMQIRPEMGGMPSNWSVYFQVDSIDGAIEKAKSLGANLIMGPQQIAGTGRFAVMQDPQGAFFNLYEGRH